MKFLISLMFNQLYILHPDHWTTRATNIGKRKLEIYHRNLYCYQQMIDDILLFQISESEKRKKGGAFSVVGIQE